MNVGAIIQARMGSTRLPGKVLLKVMGKPLLWYQLERLKQSRTLTNVIVATTLSKEDDDIKVFCNDYGVKCFRGDEKDVLGRYYFCASSHSIDPIVRVTGDCPLVEPALLDEVVGFFIENPEFDRVCTGLTYPEGLDVEVVSLASLSAAWKEAKLLSEREHVTPFIWKNPDRFNLQALELDRDFSFLRLTVDEPVDFAVVSSVIKEFAGNKGVNFTFKDILSLYNKKPQIFEKNENVIRNEGYLRSIEEELRIP